MATDTSVIPLDEHRAWLQHAFQLLAAGAFVLTVLVGVNVYLTATRVHEVHQIKRSVDKIETVANLVTSPQAAASQARSEASRTEIHNICLAFQSVGFSILCPQTPPTIPSPTTTAP